MGNRLSASGRLLGRPRHDQADGAGTADSQERPRGRRKTLLQPSGGRFFRITDRAAYRADDFRVASHARRVTLVEQKAKRAGESCGVALRIASMRSQYDGEAVLVRGEERTDFDLGCSQRSAPRRYSVGSHAPAVHEDSLGSCLARHRFIIECLLHNRPARSVTRWSASAASAAARRQIGPLPQGREQHMQT